MRAPAWRLGAVILALGACDIDNPFETVEPPCEAREAWYEDADGDGIGDDGAEVWIACEPPGDGWTLEPPPADTDTDTDSDTDSDSDTDTDTDTDTDSGDGE